MIRVYMPHQNLGCLGLMLGSWYCDLSLPTRDGFGWSGGLLRFYFRGPDGRRHWFYLPSCRHYADRKDMP